MILFTAWYEMNIIGVIIGAIITVLSFVAGHYINRKSEVKKNKQSILILVTQTNADLFSVIYRGSLNKSNIHYIKLRQELERTNVIYVLPQEIRISFSKLYKIYFTSPEYYDENKKYIHKNLLDIVSKIKDYGVDAFEYK